MKTSLILLAALTILISACSNSGSQSSTTPPAKQDNSKPNDPLPTPNQPSPISAADAKTCPFVELAGTYSVTKTDCSIDRRQDVSPDPNVIPTKYVVSSQGDTGSVDLIFANTDGAEKSSHFDFPRLPSMDDFKNFGIQCGNLENSKSFSWRCPGTTGTSCSYGLQFESGNLIAVYVRVQSNIYGCRSELSKDQVAP